MGNFKPNGLAVEVLPQNASPEMIFDDIPHQPILIAICEPRSDALHTKLKRFKTTVGDYGEGLLTRNQYVNERMLAMFCCEYGDFILQQSADSMLEASYKVTDKKQSDDFVRIAECLELRTTYTHRCF